MGLSSKLLPLCLALSLLSAHFHTSSAQEKDKAPSFSLHAGAVWEGNLKEDPGTDVIMPLGLPGLSIGPCMTYSLDGKRSLDIGLNYMLLGRYSHSASYTSHYIQAPIHYNRIIKDTPASRKYLYFGPTLSYNLSFVGRSSSTFSDATERTNFIRRDDLKRFNVLLGAGYGIKKGRMDYFGGIDIGLIGRFKESGGFYSTTYLRLGCKYAY